MVWSLISRAARLVNTGYCSFAKLEFYHGTVALAITETNYRRADETVDELLEFATRFSENSRLGCGNVKQGDGVFEMNRLADTHTSMVRLMLSLE